MTQEQQQEVLEHEGLIWHMINKINRPYILPEEDEAMYYHGMIGLIKGIKTFDESKNIKKSTYYCKCIMNEIGHYIYQSGMDVRKANNHVISLSKKIGNSDMEPIYIIPSDYNLEKDAEHEILIDQVLELIKCFSERDQNIFRLKWGIRCPKLVDSEISKIYNISCANVWSVSDKILKQLRWDMTNVRIRN